MMEEERKKKKLHIVVWAMTASLVLLVICVFTALGLHPFYPLGTPKGYIPTVTLALDRSILGQEPLILASVSLPMMVPPLPTTLAFPMPKLEADLNLDKKFSPVITPTVTYKPAY